MTGSDTNIDYTFDSRTVEHLSKSNAELFRAIAFRDNDRAQDAMLAGAQHDVKNSNGHTPLYIASYLGYSEIVQTIMEYSGDPEKNLDLLINLNTSLFAAAKKGKAKTAEYLISKGAKVTALNAEGKTPLQVAKERFMATRVSKIFLKAGAEPITPQMRIHKFWLDTCHFISKKVAVRKDHNSYVKELLQQSQNHGQHPQ